MNKKRIIALVVFLLALPFLGSAQQWIVDLKDDISNSILCNGIVNKEGDIIAVGNCGESVELSNPMIMHISNDGCFCIQVASDSLFNFMNQNLKLRGVIQLNNCNYLSTVNIPVSASHTAKFGVIVFDNDFEIVSSRLYEADTVAEKIFTEQLLLDDDGSVVMCGSYEFTRILSNGFEETISRPFFYRFNENGDSISCRYVKPTSSSDPENYIIGFECNQIKKDPRSDGFIVFGNGNYGYNSVMFYDRDFNHISQFYPKYNNGAALFQCMYSDAWIAEDRMLVYGHTWGPEAWDLMLADISLDGTVNKYDRFYSIPDTSINVNGYRGMAMANDTTIYGYYYIYKSFKSYSRRVGVSLYNKDMEVLSIKTLPSVFDDCFPLSIIPLADGGCVLICFRTCFGPYHNEAVIAKFSREDFNPIPCSVKEIPQEKLQGIVFPNPTHGELNIDISDIPDGIENRVSITDMHGVVRMSRIIRGNGNLLTIDASALETGTYVYSVFNSKTEILKGKFVKE